MPEDRIFYKKPPKYVSSEGEDLSKYIPETEEDRPIINIEKVIEEPPAEFITQVKRVTHPRLKEWKGPQSLNRKTPEVFGTLFDRLRFLEARGEELESMMDERARLHDEVIKEIEEDIEDKEKVVARIADIEERRNFKLDISILKRDKRFELLQFWRDIMELRTELREVMEHTETERNIVNIFQDIGGDASGIKGVVPDGLLKSKITTVQVNGQETDRAAKLKE